MFDSLANALSKAYRAIVGQKTLTEANVDEGIRAVVARGLGAKGSALGRGRSPRHADVSTRTVASPAPAFARYRSVSISCSR